MAFSTRKATCLQQLEAELTPLGQELHSLHLLLWSHVKPCQTDEFKLLIDFDHVSAM